MILLSGSDVLTFDGLNPALPRALSACGHATCGPARPRSPHARRDAPRAPDAQPRALRPTTPWLSRTVAADPPGPAAAPAAPHHARSRTRRRRRPRGLGLGLGEHRLDLSVDHLVRPVRLQR